MNKQDLVNAVAARADLGKADVSAVIGHALAVIQETVAAGDKVTVTGWGTFEQAYKPARDARNPSTGDTVKVDESWVVKFRPGSDFKAAVNQGGKSSATQQAA